MKIWLVTVGEPLPTDPGNQRLHRAGMLSKILGERGDEVTWWTSTFDHYRKVQRSNRDALVEVQGVRIRMLRGCGYPSNISLKRFFEHEGVARKFRAQAQTEPRPDVILCSYPTIELSREAVRYGLRHRVPVLLDIRDLWPDVLFDVFPLRLSWLSRATLLWLTAQARFALRNCTGIVALSKGYLDWGLRYARRGLRQHDGVYPLGYVLPAPDEAALRNAGAQLSGLGVDASKMLCWFVGSLSRQFDLTPIIEAARTLQDNGWDDVQFVISGQGELLEQWRDMAKDLRNVLFTGWIGANEIAWLRDRACIGLQPYAARARMGLANKLFEYLSAGLPILSTLKGENEALLSQHKCGLTCKPGDIKDFIAKLQLLLGDSDLRRDMGKRAKRLFDKQFSASVVYGGLVSHLERISAEAFE